MAEVDKSVLVAHTAPQMFALVDDVEQYPRFLPWCGGSELNFRDARVTRATLHINYRGLKQSISTENLKDAPRLMQIRLIAGPFRDFEGSWRFSDLGGTGCRIDFRLHYEFSSRLFEKLVGPVFSYIGNSLVDAFVRRADELYD